MRMKTKTKYLFLLFFIGIMLFSNNVMAAEQTNTGTLDIRSGAADEDAYGLLEDYKAGLIDKAFIENIINSGGFSPSVAEKVRAEMAIIDAENSHLEAPAEQPTITPTIQPMSEPTIEPIPTMTTTPIVTPTSEPLIGPTATPVSTPIEKPVTVPTENPLSGSAINPTMIPATAPTTTPTMTETENNNISVFMIPIFTVAIIAIATKTLKRRKK